MTHESLVIYLSFKFLLPINFRKTCHLYAILVTIDTELDDIVE